MVSEASTRSILEFDRGTLRLVGAVASPSLPFATWDPRTLCLRAPAFRYGEIRVELPATIEDRLAPRLARRPLPWRVPPLRPYQAEALGCWRAGGERGIIVLPTGSGKTRTALAAMAHASVPCLVLVPTRALLAQWGREVRAFYGGTVGIVGDGAHDVQPVTIMTFESAYRQLDAVGGRFGMIVADEVHHFGGGVRAEALEMAAAPLRLGLTATAPPPDSPQAATLSDLVGPVVFEIELRSLVGTHLADFEHVIMHVELTRSERARYDELVGPFQAFRRDFTRRHPEASFQDLVVALSAIPEGRRALAYYHEAEALASLPAAKLERLAALLARVRHERVLVFTGSAQAAVEISRRWLAPVITAETSRAEREEILDRFREGRYRVLVSARVLNEGLDVPEASVAIIVAGALGRREQIQRMGRVLRPRPGKRAVIYELVTIETMDHRRSRSRRVDHAAA
jgi:superfamily II DNA or RNA helicase